MRYSTFAGFVGLSGRDVMLKVGQEFDDNAPIVKAHPALFADKPPAADRPVEVVFTGRADGGTDVETVQIDGARPPAPRRRRSS